MRGQPENVPNLWDHGGVKYASFPCPHNFSFDQAWFHWRMGVSMIHQPYSDKPDDRGGGWCVGIVTPKGRLVRVLPIERCEEWYDHFTGDKRVFTIWGVKGE